MEFACTEDEENPHAIKLTLARELHALGDAEGARSLIEEVAAESTGELRNQARRLLARDALKHRVFRHGAFVRLALGVRYDGRAYDGWQSQPSGRTVQDRLEAALGTFAGRRMSTLCAGRTDAGVHALMQVVHFDTDIERAPFSWVRGSNRYLPGDIAGCSGAQPVPDAFHCRASALARRYVYVLSQSPVRPSLDAGRVGWSIHPLDGEAMRAGAAWLIGQHDFSSFRASACQALSPVKTMRRIEITHRDEGLRSRWHFEFEADAFLHHMIRNIMGCLVRIGQGKAPPGWMSEVLQARSRLVAAPTFSAAGLYFLGPLYDAQWGLPADVTRAARRCVSWAAMIPSIAPPPSRTRLKICGLTREQDVDAAVAAGADAVGFVLWAPSPRAVRVERAAELAARLPPFVTPVLLFVNETPEAARAALARVPGAVAQFHGEETPAQCLQASGHGAHRFLRAARIPLGAAGAGFDLVEFAQEYAAAQAILLDAHVEGYGGGGKAFDWSRLPHVANARLVLSGGLTPANVGDGIRMLRPWAVDVSSGVESAKGIKDAGKIREFVAAVRRADDALAAS